MGPVTTKLPTTVDEACDTFPAVNVPRPVRVEAPVIAAVPLTERLVPIELANTDPVTARITPTVKAAATAGLDAKNFFVLVIVLLFTHKINK